MADRTWIKMCPAFLAGFLLVFGPSLRGISQADDQPAAASEPAEYIIEDIQGSNVQVLEEGAKEWEPAVEGQVVDSGDEVKVGTASEATLTLQSETSVHLGEGTDLKVEQIEANPSNGFLSRLQVVAGTLLADVKKHLLESHSTFEVESNGVVCGVRGTAFEVNAQGDTAQVATHEGSVEVGNGTETHTVEAGNFSSFQKGKFQMQRRLDKSETGRFQKWRALRTIVLKKRLQRLEDIREHKRTPWKRRHPQLERAILRHELKKKRRHLN
jgi:hypothetical protein